MKLEKMAEFFEARLSDYDEHMLRDIEGAGEFYPYTASLLPTEENARVLDLGCGTGLELGYYFVLNDSARITAVDLSAAMLNALAEKFPDRDIECVQGSYFKIPLGEGIYDAAVSVESLHHFAPEDKLSLYRRLHAALKDGGYFVLTDYFADTDADERFFFDELARLKREQGISDEEFYHYDTPLTVGHEQQLLLDAGFGSVKIMKNWNATHTIVAAK